MVLWKIQSVTRLVMAKFSFTWNAPDWWIQIWLTDREKEAVIPGESETLHCPLVVGDGIATTSVLDIPNADKAPVAVTATSCWCYSLDTNKQSFILISQSIRRSTKKDTCRTWENGRLHNPGLPGHKMFEFEFFFDISQTFEPIAFEKTFRSFYTENCTNY